MKKLIISFITVFLAVNFVEGQYVARRGCYSTYIPQYQVRYNTYNTPVHNYNYHPIPELVEYRKDYYFSIDGYYRDKLLVDAIVGRLVQLQSPANPQGHIQNVPKNIVPQNQAPVQPQNPAQNNNGPINTQVKPDLQKIVQDKCIKCHSGNNSNRMNLSNLASLGAGERWYVHGLVNSGEMPKGGPQLTDNEVLLVYEWAKQGASALRANK